jgi:hypothetical protein
MRMKDWQILFVVWFAAIGITVLCIGEFYVHGYFSKKYSAYGLTQEIIDSKDKFVFLKKEGFLYLNNNHEFDALDKETKSYLEHSLLALKNSNEFGFFPVSYGVDGGAISGCLNLQDIEEDKKCKDFLDNLYESLKDNETDEEFIKALGFWVMNNLTYEKNQHDLYRGTKTLTGNCQVHAFIVKEMLDRHGFDTSYFFSYIDKNGHISVVYRSGGAFFVVDFTGVDSLDVIERISKQHDIYDGVTARYGAFMFGDSYYVYDKDSSSIHVIDKYTGKIKATQRWGNR